MTLLVNVLYTDDCLDWQTYVELVDMAIQELGFEAEYTYTLITSDRDAMDNQFIGSPTIRINDEDLFPVKGAASGKRLRSYFTAEGMVGYPTYEMILDALSRFQ
nr:hypothetical protein [Anaerolineae bacterium]